MPFPEIDDFDFSEIPESLDHNPQVVEALDWAIMQYHTRRDRHDRIDKLYNAHNGVIDQSEIDSIIKFTGKKSKTKYVKYRLGRSKLKLVHGEFLEIGLAPTVTSINRSAQNERMQKYRVKNISIKTAGHMEETTDYQGGFLVPDEYKAELLSVGLEDVITMPFRVWLTMNTPDIDFLRLSKRIKEHRVNMDSFHIGRTPPGTVTCMKIRVLD